jgi:antitoxin ParD1/3/4
MKVRRVAPSAGSWARKLTRQSVADMFEGMDGINVTVPEALHEFVQVRVVEGGYGSVNEYIGELIRADQKQHALAVLGTEILKGAHSGPSVPMTDSEWDDIRREVRQRFQARQSG